MGGNSDDGRALPELRTSGGGAVLGPFAFGGPASGVRPILEGVAADACLLGSVRISPVTTPPCLAAPARAEFAPCRTEAFSPEVGIGVVLVRLRGRGTEGGSTRVGMSLRLEGIGRASDDLPNIDAIVMRPPSCRLNCREATLLLRART